MIHKFLPLLIRLPCKGKWKVQVDLGLRVHLRLHGDGSLPEQQPRWVDRFAEEGQAAVEEGERLGAVFGRWKGGHVELEFRCVKDAELCGVVLVEGFDVVVEFLFNDR